MKKKMYKKAIIKYSEYTVLRALLKRRKINLNLGDYDSISAKGLTKAGITTLTYHKQRPKYLILTTRGKALLNKIFKQSKYPKNYQHLMNKAKIVMIILAINFEILVISITLNMAYSFNTEYFSIVVAIPMILIMLWIAKHHFLISYPIITKNRFFNQIQHTNGISWNEDLISLFTLKKE